jgi:hypothetical protein
MKIQFKDFLLNEDKAYLGQRIGNILSALQDLVQNAKGMGTRHLVQSSETIINQIRRILHTHWPQEHEDGLKRLQKVAVAISKAIEDQDDLEGILQSGSQELEGLLGDMDTPVNQLTSPPEEEQPKEPAEPTGEPQGEMPPEAPQMPPGPAPAAPGAPMAPGMGPAPMAAPGPPGAPPGPPMGMPGMMPGMM